MHDPDHAHLLPPCRLYVTVSQSLGTALKDADVMVSLVGLLGGALEQFERIQSRGAGNVATTTSMVGAKPTHFSAIDAAVNSTIPYWRTKGLGRSVWTWNDFFTKLAGLATFLPFMPVFGGGTTQFQPVFVGDPAHTIQTIIEPPETRNGAAGKIIEAEGPEFFTYKEVVDLVLRYARRWRPIMSIPTA